MGKWLRSLFSCKGLSLDAHFFHDEGNSWNIRSSNYRIRFDRELMAAKAGDVASRRRGYSMYNLSWFNLPSHAPSWKLRWFKGLFVTRCSHGNCDIGSCSLSVNFYDKWQRQVFLHLETNLKEVKLPHLSYTVKGDENVSLLCAQL